jgi:hypothetical protein
LIDEKNIATTLKKNQKNISVIRIDRLYPNNLKILLSGYPILFRLTIAHIPNYEWGLTENGVLIPKEKTEGTPPYVMQYVDPSLSSDVPLEYRELIPEAEAYIIKKTLEFFQTTWSDIQIESVAYLAQEKELHFLLNNKTLLILTTQNFSRKPGENPTDFSHLQKQVVGLKAYIDNNY